MAANPRRSSQGHEDVAKCDTLRNHARPIDLYLNPEQYLSDRQKEAIVLLLHGANDTEVAQEVGVNRMTIHRWRKHGGFNRELERQRSLHWERFAGQLQTMIEPALDVIRQQLAGGDPKTKLRAASILLRFANPVRLSRATRRLSDGDEHFRAIKAYLDAPMPGQAGAPADLLDQPDEDDDSGDGEREEKE